MKNSGITLIELLIVIAIIGIIAALVTLDAGWFQREGRVTEARDRLLADLEDAKLKSLAKIPHGIVVADAKTSYKMVCLKDGTCSGSANRCCQDSDCPSGQTCSLTSTSVNFKKDSGESYSDIVNSTVTLPTNVKITPSGETWFDRKGISKSSTWGTGNTTFTIWYDSTSNGSVDSDEISKTIIISDNGRIQYEKR